MENFITHVDRLIVKLKKLENSESLYTDESDTKKAIANAALNGLYVDSKDFCVALNRFRNNKEYIRTSLQIRMQNNAKVKNIEMIVKIIREFECYFISIDKIKVDQEDNIIYLDFYRLDDF